MGNENFKVLLVEDCDASARMTRRNLQTRDPGEPAFDVTHVGSLAAAREHLSKHSFDAVLLDLQLPDSDEAGTVAEVSELCPDLPIVALTAAEDDGLCVRSLLHGAQDHLLKQEATPRILRRAIENAVYRQQIASRHRRLMTELGDAKRLLEHKNRKLAERYRMAHQFVDNVSHEFRTPLTVIKEFASIIRDGLSGAVTPEQREYLGIVLDRVEDLSVMVDDMLDISKIEAGMLHLCRRRVPLQQIIDRVRPVLLHRATACKITLVIDIPEDLPPLFCDAEKIGRILINLVINALKFTEEGGHVRIWADIAATEEDIRIGVTDDGRGIPHDQVRQLFERFQQGDTPARAGCKGFGLGLSISRDLVAIHLGTMSVESVEGRGSTFWFCIPRDDPTIVLRRYVEKCRRASDGPRQIALFTAVAPADAGRDVLESTDHLLQSQVRCTDLSLQDTDHSWLLAAAVHEGEVNQLNKRIEATWKDISHHMLGGQSLRLAIQPEGHWPVESADPDVLEAYRHAASRREVCHV